MSDAFPALLDGQAGPTQKARFATSGDLEGYYPLIGGVPMRGDVDMGGHDMPNLQKFWSDNWDGAIPPDLSTGADAAATVGVAYDGKAGAFQAQVFYGATAPPTGGISMYGGAAAPSGWVLCDGTTYDSDADSTYAPLFAVIGTTFGGTGSNDFVVPDLRDNFVIGKSGTLALGATGGSFDHTHTGPSHSHSHSHSFSDSFTTGGPSSTGSVDTGLSLRASSSHTHSGSVSGTTGGNASSGGTGATGSNNPPYVALNYIVKL